MGYPDKGRSDRQQHKPGTMFNDLRGCACETTVTSKFIFFGKAGQFRPGQTVVKKTLYTLIVQTYYYLLLNGKQTKAKHNHKPK